MAREDSALNQDLNKGISSFSPAQKHVQDDSPETVVPAIDNHAALDRLGMESAKRAGNRMKRNVERIPTNTIFSK